MTFLVNIANTLPTITEIHKQNGVLPRYFAAKANHIDKQVFEIARRDYYNLQDNRYIILGHLNWLITGPLEDREVWVYTGSPIYDMGGKEPISIPGLLTQNRAAVRFLSGQIPAVKNYFDRPNAYEEFWEPEAST